MIEKDETGQRNDHENQNRIHDDTRSRAYLIVDASDDAVAIVRQARKREQYSYSRPRYRSATTQQHEVIFRCQPEIGHAFQEKPLDFLNAISG